jgi:hypothetical protein
MKQEAIAYSRLVKMFSTPPSFSLSDKEIDALKKADTFLVRFEDWDLPCYGGAIVFKFHSHTRWFQQLMELAETIV